MNSSQQRLTFSTADATMNVYGASTSFNEELSKCNSSFKFKSYLQDLFLQMKVTQLYKY